MSWHRATPHHHEPIGNLLGGVAKLLGKMAIAFALSSAVVYLIVSGHR